MQTLEKNITSFEKILAIVQNDYLSKEELLTMLEKIVAIVKDMREKQNTLWIILKLLTPTFWINSRKTKIQIYRN